MHKKTKLIALVVLALILAAAAILWTSRKPVSAQLVTKGLAFLDEEKYDEALICFNKAYKWYGKSAQALLGMARSEYHLSRFQQALEHVGSALVIDSSLTDGYYYRGLLYIKSEKKKNALADFSRVISLDSLYARAYYQRGIVRAGMLDYLGSVAD
jgi:tetratricopeptide (TPR) repeat protein